MATERKRPDASEITEVFVDESSQNNHRYLVLGAVVVGLLDSDELCRLLQAAREPELPKKEAKWVKVSKKKIAPYKRMVDVLFDNSGIVHFHSLFVDTFQVNHHKFNDGDREIGFNKEIFQLARKVSRLYATDLFHLYPDYRNTSQTPENLRLILNRHCDKAGDKRDWPFRRCQFRDPAATLPLQLADIITGALAFHLNGHVNAEGASPYKTELAQYVLDRAKVKDVLKGTTRSGEFTIWPRQLRK